MKKNILITGACGQLGLELQKILHNDSMYNVFATDVADLDITNKEAVESYIVKNSIDIIINCAAYTAVDKAEDNLEFCRALNAQAPAFIANAALKQGAKLIHVSTDYVFDGTNCKPYTEDDIPMPKSVYGITKFEGEKLVMQSMPDALIVRTSWLYSSHGNNFVKTMLNLGHTRDKLSVVSDQIGTPTYAGDLAFAIVQIVKNDEWHPGIYHFSNEGVCSWYDFTKMIHKLSGITSCEVLPIASKDYPAKAPRPSYSVLDKTKIKKTFGISIPYWLDSLETCLKELDTNNQN